MVSPQSLSSEVHFRILRVFLDSPSGFHTVPMSMLKISSAKGVADVNFFKYVFHGHGVAELVIVHSPRPLYRCTSLMLSLPISYSSLAGHRHRRNNAFCSSLPDTEGAARYTLPSLDKLGHIAIEECQQQCTDMGAVHVGIGHDNDFMITGFQMSHPQKCRYEAVIILRISSLLRFCPVLLFHVQNFTRRGGWPVFWGHGSDGRTARGIPFDNIDFAFVRVAVGAVCELAGHTAFPDRFCGGQVLFAFCVTGSGSADLFDDDLPTAGFSRK